MSDRPYIICIDDERIILDAFKEQVKLKFGDQYNIGLAESADEALLFFSELINQGNVVPIVICDYLMPKIKGDELLCRMREISTDTVMVMLTGQADLFGIKNALNNAGIFKYIAKPWLKEDLYLIIEEALDYFYNNIKYKENHIKLKETNSYLKDALESKTVEFKRKNNIHKSVEKAKQSSETVRRMTDEVKESLVLIKSGIETMKKLKCSIGVEDNEKLVSYISSFDDYFSNIINSMNQLAYTVVENSDEMKIEMDTNDEFNDALDESNSVRAGILESINELTDRISRIEKLFEKTVKKIVAWDDEKILLFNLDEVLFFASENRNIFATTKKGKYRVRENISQLEKNLNEHNFFRCHKSYLINLDYVSKIEPWIGYDSYVSKIEGYDEEIPISRNYIKDMKRIFGI